MLASKLLITLVAALCCCHYATCDGTLHAKLLNDAFQQASRELEDQSRHNAIHLKGHPRFRRDLKSMPHPHAIPQIHLRVTAESALLNKNFNIALRAAEILRNDSRINSTRVKLRAPPQFCPFNNDMTCDATLKYRTLDASCNNPGSPLLGKASSAFKRLTPAAYDDKINSPRATAQDGQPLPNARHVSIIIHDPLELPYPKINHLGVMFGQFLDHDIALSGSTSDPGSNEALKCTCDSSSSDCVNIVDTDDDDQTCMVLTRSGGTFQKFDCDLNAREQLNLVSHFADLSQIYSNDDSTTSKLRSMTNGLLVTSTAPDSDRTFLPLADAGTCVEESGDQLCFLSGDVRTSQTMPLASIHTMFMREHNRVAKLLFALNPTWTDENLYQESRRIMIAQYQNMIYGQWLPIIVGPRSMAAHGMNIQHGTFTKYNPDINPSLSAEFSTAAYRFGHSLVRSFVTKRDKDNIEIANLTLTSVFLRPVEAYTNGGLDALCRGMTADLATLPDPHFTSELQNHLFQNDGSSNTKHFSLSAINVMRGRDHGISPYNKLRKLAGLKEATLFKHFDEIPHELRNKLKKLYTSPADVDAFTGGTSELSMSEGVLGPTFNFIVSSQFRDLKFGDRFYFEHGDAELTRFKMGQLTELRKGSMSRMLCDNMELGMIQVNAFLPVSRENPLVKCSDIPKTSYDLWLNEPVTTAST